MDRGGLKKKNPKKKQIASPNPTTMMLLNDQSATPAYQLNSKRKWWLWPSGISHTDKWDFGSNARVPPQLISYIKSKKKMMMMMAKWDFPYCQSRCSPSQWASPLSPGAAGCQAAHQPWCCSCPETRWARRWCTLGRGSRAERSGAAEHQRKDSAGSSTGGTCTWHPKTQGGRCALPSHLPEPTEFNKDLISNSSICC